MCNMCNAYKYRHLNTRVVHISVETRQVNTQTNKRIMYHILYTHIQVYNSIIVGVW